MIWMYDMRMPVFLAKVSRIKSMSWLTLMVMRLVAIIIFHYLEKNKTGGSNYDNNHANDNE